MASNGTLKFVYNFKSKFITVEVGIPHHIRDPS